MLFRILVQLYVQNSHAHVEKHPNIFIDTYGAAIKSIGVPLVFPLASSLANQESLVLFVHIIYSSPPYSFAVLGSCKRWI